MCAPGGCTPGPCLKGFRAPENPRQGGACLPLTRVQGRCPCLSQGNIPRHPQHSREVSLMAIYHLHASVVHRSLGHSAVAAAAYAAGKELYNARAEKMETYGRKHGVFYTEIIAPDKAPEWVYERQQLWNRAERAEKRIDAQTARVFVLALPHEFNDEQKIALVNDYVRGVLVSKG